MGVAKPAPAPNARPGATGAQARTGSSVVLAFVPSDERALAGTPGMSIGIISATQGAFVREQMLLDIGQGARIASSAYKPSYPPVLSLLAQGGAAQISGWQAALHRADDAPQLLQPGLLASSLAGGVGYAGVTGADGLGALAAVDRRGHIASVSLGSSATLLARIAALRARSRLVVAELPGGTAGIAELHALAAGRPGGELLIAVQRASDGHGHELLWAGVAGLPDGGGRELTSRTTNQRGLLSAIDIAPTILDYLGLRVPDEMRGERIETDGALDSAGLRSLMARLHVVGGRRLKAFGVLLCAWAALLLAAVLLDSMRGAPRDGVAGAGERRNRMARAWAMRVGALAVLWTPTAVLVTAAIEPSAGVEYAAIALLCLGLGALSDVLLPWPRAPLAPAVVSVLALTIDALAGTQLLMRSLLGPNPIIGARFYGFGNELKSGLAVLVLGAVAAVLYPAVRSRRAALAMAGAGIVLATIEGSARIGAGVGGVILVAAGAAVATIVLLPGGFSRRRVLLVVCAPLLALVLLAAIDLLTAHGSGHYTGSILHARSAGDLRDVIVRRYTAAWNELKNHAMPFATALALIYGITGVRLRERLLAPVGGDPAWLAALAGGFTAGVIGMLVEDSGPVLLVVAVFTLGCVCAYLWGRPAPRLPSPPASPRTPPASAPEP
jgi:hypothetical protein